MSKLETMNEAEIQFNDARAKGELHKLFGGYPEYAIVDRIANNPTDWAAAFSRARMTIGKDIPLRAEVVDAIKKLAHDREYGWMAIYYVSQVADFKRYHNLDLINEDFIKAVADGLRANKEVLISSKKWGGADHEEGLWALVKNGNRNLYNDYNIAILPEEL